PPARGLRPRRCGVPRPNERLPMKWPSDAGTIGAMSPRSRKRRPSRGRPHGVGRQPGNDSWPGAGQTTDFWFDEPAPDDRRSWVMPPAHGTYQGLDLELLDPSDEDELTFLIEAQHTESEPALRSDEEMII